MAMQPIFSRVNWENLPSRKTPLNETNLNKSDSALRTIDDRVVELDTVKADKTTILKHVKDINLNEVTGVLTIMWENGKIVSYDTALEKIATNFNYDPDTEELILYDESGAELARIDLSGLIIPDNFVDTDNIAWDVKVVWDAAHKHKSRTVTPTIKQGSITDELIQPHYLADIKIEAQNAANSASQAASSESASAYNAQLAQSYAIGTNGEIRENDATDNAKYYKEQAYTFKENARVSSQNSGVYERLSEAWARGTMDGNPVSPTEDQYQNNSKYYAEQSAASARSSATSADNSATSEHNASVSEGNAKTSEDNAQSYMNTALQARDEANTSALQASNAATRANNSANAASQSASVAEGILDDCVEKVTDAEAWAVGQRGGVNVDSTDETYHNNSKYYAEQGISTLANTQSVYEDTVDVRDQINTMLQMAEFDVNADGFLTYTDNSGFVFTVDENGMLNWEVS